MKIILIIGLPGSGKTHYAQHLVASDALLIDDCTKDDIDSLPTEGDYNTLIIIDPNFCIPGILECAVAYINHKYNNPIFEFIYFENAPDKALRNVAHRNDGRAVVNFIKDNTENYFPPADSLEIWQPENSS